MTSDNAESLSLQVSQVLDLVSRTDERVKSVVEGQAEVKCRIDELSNSIHSLSIRVSVLETRRLDETVTNHTKNLANLEREVLLVKGLAGRQETRWATIFNTAFQIIVSVAAGYLLFRFGIKP